MLRQENCQAPSPWPYHWDMETTLTNRFKKPESVTLRSVTVVGLNDGDSKCILSGNISGSEHDLRVTTTIHVSGRSNNQRLAKLALRWYASSEGSYNPVFWGYTGSMLEKSKSGQSFSSKGDSVPVSHDLPDVSCLRLTHLAYRLPMLWIKRTCHSARASTGTPRSMRNCKPCWTVCNVRVRGLTTIRHWLGSYENLGARCSASFAHCLIPFRVRSGSCISHSCA